jgi:hypothetical protein
LQDYRFGAFCHVLFAAADCVSHIRDAGSYSAANSVDFAPSNIAERLADPFDIGDQPSSFGVANVFF